MSRNRRTCTAVVCTTSIDPDRPLDVVCKVCLTKYWVHVCIHVWVCAFHMESSCAWYIRRKFTYRRRRLGQSGFFTGIHSSLPGSKRVRTYYASLQVIQCNAFSFSLSLFSRQTTTYQIFAAAVWLLLFTGALLVYDTHIYHMYPHMSSHNGDQPGGGVLIWTTIVILVDACTIVQGIDLLRPHHH